MTKQPVLQKLIDRCSSLLLLAGGAVFLFAIRFGYRIKQENAVADGMIAGVFLMLLGVALAIANKSKDISPRKRT